MFYRYMQQISTNLAHGPCCAYCPPCHEDTGTQERGETGIDPKPKSEGDAPK